MEYSVPKKSPSLIMTRKIGKFGRLVLPDKYRELLGMQPGIEVIVSLCMKSKTITIRCGSANE